MNRKKSVTLLVMLTVHVLVLCESMNEAFDWYLPGSGQTCFNGVCTQYLTTCDDDGACKRQKCSQGSCTYSYNDAYLKKRGPVNNQREVAARDTSLRRKPAIKVDCTDTAFKGGIGCFLHRSQRDPRESVRPGNGNLIFCFQFLERSPFFEQTAGKFNCMTGVSSSEGHYSSEVSGSIEKTGCKSPYAASAWKDYILVRGFDNTGIRTYYPDSPDYRGTAVSGRFYRCGAGGTLIKLADGEFLDSVRAVFKRY
ncbi:MAG: hypothetical protein KDK27_17715 [Leptospiraceae bacterium]|nr:hypothetical protein [Leptospiraceae bacterium]